ncbi:hypothetical protein SAMN05421848_1634 [Kushneria avicenniae]|uniref:Uncharacterized protein n=1 Tax=Kushneria avicenniae TaxID=402385 RepID=A0A1I1JMX8_9GAMM|nr:hypothetical protein [Kushneria avicenniae]SFC49312.1 hypothetical protein SAMN05421848_1634 [Kushneria avicenniae]
MPIDAGFPYFKELELKNDRYRNFYASALRQEMDRGKGIDSSYSGMVDYFKSLQEDKKTDVILKLIDARKAKLLSEEDFSWIKDERRICNFVWCVLKWATDDQIKIMSFIDQKYDLPKSNAHTTFFDNIVETEDFFDIKNSYQKVVAFFDNWNELSITKNNMMDKLKKGWEYKRREKIKLAWLNFKNKEQCDWAWDYMKIKFEKHLLNKMFWSLRPLNSEQAYYCAFAVLDYWEAEVGTKELFVLKLKKLGIKESIEKNNPRNHR